MASFDDEFAAHVGGEGADSPEPSQVPLPTGTATSSPPADDSITPPKGSSFHIPSLDGIRAVSFMFVFVGHAGYGHIVPGGFGVTVFFFLSGYLITTLLRRELAETGGVGYRNFLLRRFLRIAPSYVVVLGTAVLITATGILTAELTAGPVLSQLLLVNNYWQIKHGLVGSAPGTEVFWSISVEEHFYLLFPALFGWLAIRFRTERSRAAVVAAMCGAVLIWRSVLVLAMGAGHLRTYAATDTRVDSILFGVVLGLVLNPAWGPTVAWKHLRWLVGAAVLVLTATLIPRSEVFRETIRYSLQGIALVPLFLAAVSYPARPLFRWLNLAGLRWVGRLSYGAYLVHFVVLEIVWAWLPLPTPAAAAVALVLTLALANVLFRTVDVPIMRVRARYR